MAGAIRLGRYFLANALAAYDALPEKGDGGIREPGPLYDPGKAAEGV